MLLPIRAALLLFSLALAAQLLGCTHSDSSPSNASTDPLHGDPLGYYEVSHEGTIYVLGSIQSRDALRAEKIPPTMRSGFSSQGQSVLFETGPAGLTERLMAEYDRRHRLSH